MKNHEGIVLYIGKAKDLRNRVKTYFQKGYAHSTRTKKLLDNTEDIEYIVTDNELEAYILETNLIKELRPRYNILMKDDKNFVYIKIQLNEDFPRIRVVRKMEKDGAKYIGPKTGAVKVFEFFRILKKLFPFRHCQLDIEWKDSTYQASAPDPSNVKVTNQVIDYPCLDYFIKRCPGPCVGATTTEEYRSIVNQIIDFLEGRGDELLKKLRTQMMEAATQKKFELAARLRDKLLTVKEMMEKQKASDPERKDTDVIHFHVEFSRAYVNIFLIRDGKLIRHENFVLDAFEIQKTGDAPSSEILESFMKAYYEKAADIPKEILIPEPIEDQEILGAWISEMKGEKVKILVPQKGEKNKLLELSRKNAETFAKQYRLKFMAAEEEKQAVADLSEALELIDQKTKRLLELRRIECYDISHLGGEHTVGSMVVFENGFPKREHYRHFKLRTVQGKPDDFASMTEVLSRRLKYIAEKDQSIKFRFGTKKDLSAIGNIAEKVCGTRKKQWKRDFLPRNFLLAQKDKEIVSLCLLTTINNLNILEYLWVKDSERDKQLGYRLMDILLEKKKIKRAYVYCYPEMEAYYSTYGYVVLKMVPEALRLRAEEEKWGKWEPIFMVFDRKKRNLDPSFSLRPQLMVVDGGKPQLSAALQALKEANLEIPVCALAKRLEEIYLPGKQAPILLEAGEEALKLLQRLRDEAHRFAIEFQRDLKRKNLFSK